MADPRGAWQSVRRRPALALSAGGLVALLVSGTIAAALALQAATPPSVAAVPPSRNPGPDARPSPTISPSPTPSPTPAPTPGIGSLLGADGRFTILLLG